MRHDKAPFPWFGGKTAAAPIIWERLGDVGHYVEPFAGSLAALLLRPHECNRAYHSETVNDVDGLLCNAWRSIQLSPNATAEWASWPVSELDLTARHLWLVRFLHEQEPALRLAADPDWHDPCAAGYWLWGISCWIGRGWCTGTGPWTVGADGRVWKQAPARGGTREPGVDAQLPHLGNNGQGVNHAGTREPGVKAQLPHLGNNGQGVNRPQAREPGVSPGTPDRAWEVEDFHPMTMPELRRWFAFLSARLRHVRIICGDWRRAVTRSACITLSCDADRPAGVFLDPPYAVGERDTGLYAHDDTDGSLPAAVRAWCAENGGNPLMRIALAGYSGEGHEELEALGWECVEWFKSGFLTGGMGNQGANGHQQKRERLWFSPHCLGVVDPRQGRLF